MPRLHPIAAPAGILASLLLLAGIGSGCEANASDSGSSPKPTEDPDALRVEQFAGKVSPIKSNFEEAIEKWEDSNCFSLDIANDDITCGMEMTLLKGGAAIAYMQMATIAKRDAPAYAGQPPAELADLYERTVNIAHTAEGAAHKVETTTCSADDDCLASISAFESAVDDLGDVFDEWEPYL